MREFLKKNSNIIITIFFLFLIFLLVDNIVGKSIIGRSQYNNYELQAKAWLDGKTYLDRNYEYLELAIYNNEYYVSFPPFPSVVLLPFVIIFKDSIPTNLIAFIIFVIEFVVIYKILKRYNNSDLIALLLACGFTVGTNLFSLAIDSGVWFIAQIINNCLCILAIDAFLKERKTWVYLFLSLAVGCRPFSAIYMIMFFVYYLIKEKDIKLFKRILKNLKPIIPSMVIAIIYMGYNYIRFKNVLEFGHNYLPEFIRATYGQFSLYYLLPNLKQLFFNGIHIRSNLNMSFDRPFSFFIANPVIIMYCYRGIKNIIKTSKFNLIRLLVFIAITVNIILICLHRTLGAMQFGARYTCDFLPFIFLALMTYKDKRNYSLKLNKFEIACIIFGIILNILGAIMLYTNRLV